MQTIQNVDWRTSSRRAIRFGVYFGTFATIAWGVLLLIMAPTPSLGIVPASIVAGIPLGLLGGIAYLGNSFIIAYRRLLRQRRDSIRPQ